MSNSTVEMKTITAQELRYNDVFEMLGNLYQVDAIIGFLKIVEVRAHLIAQIDTPRALDGDVAIQLDRKTNVSIEA